MLNPPPWFTNSETRSLVADGWDLEVAEMVYRPVGFGTHHWDVRAADGSRWFFNLDELAGRRLTGDEPLSGPLARLRATLSVPRALRDHGYDFAVAPVPDREGEVVTAVEERFATSLYPYLVDGKSYEWSDEGWSGEHALPEHRLAIVDMLTALHTAPRSAWGSPGREDFLIPGRSACAEILAEPADSLRAAGPFAESAQRLIAENEGRLRGLFARYDELAARGAAQESRFVLTHGEPHPGNTMRVADRFFLIDWDTALAAPPERDLWDLEPDMVARHTERSGIEPDPELLGLYRLRWDLAEVSGYTSLFLNPHHDGANERASWKYLDRTLDALNAGGGGQATGE